ncbi:MULTISPECIES: hypothetical protein [unclassified Bradyrhizobium]|uniref:hypothetical protein n=1 Tax=Bradyrhizobium sp. USDA 4541 TaxID=2817704 RepID=UPI0020A24E1A|nr:hypothetical protein [Bradyrhizobium sp. USDA 4541]MCP1852742.1 hypothetical protein [Bradyrhizobium sp. USDA 4541]
MEILHRSLADPVAGRITADGYVEGPASEVSAQASYTFEADIDGRWHRWTGQRPEIVGDRARFWLRDGTPIGSTELRRSPD